MYVNSIIRIHTWVMRLLLLLPLIAQQLHKRAHKRDHVKQAFLQAVQYYSNVLTMSYMFCFLLLFYFSFAWNWTEAFDNKSYVCILERKKKPLQLPVASGKYCVLHSSYSCPCAEPSSWPPTSTHWEYIPVRFNGRLLYMFFSFPHELHFIA